MENAYDKVVYPGYKIYIHLNYNYVKGKRQ